MAGYLTAPVQSSSMPRGIPYIIGNEAAERFSFYGMKTILFVFMTKYLLDAQGNSAFMTETQAREAVAWFVASAYFFPVFGALLSDVVLGKYRTIIALSVVYCLGHLALALMDLPEAVLQATYMPKVWLGMGLLLVAVGSGGIKPCVSAHVGDQFGESNKHLLEKIFGWFYFAINFGSFFSTLLTPWLLKHHGPGWAFGVPGILMALATFAFWSGRRKFVHVPPAGVSYLRRTFTGEGLGVLLKLAPIYLFIAVFWSLYDQTGSAWVEQAQQMDRHFLGVDWLESQVQAVNPLLILVFIPLFAFVIYPVINRVFPLNPMRKIGLGLFLTVIAFCVSAGIQEEIGKVKSAFAEQIRPAFVAGQVDLQATIQSLKVAGEQDDAARIEKLGTNGEPEKRLQLLAEGGIVMVKDGSAMRAQWPNIGWQILAYLIITAAEVLVSITALEFSYTQAPAHMKSLVMSLYLLSVSAGNAFTALVNRFTMDASGNSTLQGADYYWFFTKLMFGMAVVFIFVGRFYKPREYLQHEEPVAGTGQPAKSPSR